MDNVLVPYLTAEDDRERQQHLDELLTLRAAPLIRQVLRRKLRFYLSALGKNENNQDAEDLYQEAIMRVVQVLTQQFSSGTHIENFELYVSRMTSNLCTDFVRAKSPAHTRLKYSLRDLFKRHRDLVSWEHDDEILCGFARWRNSGKSIFSDQSSAEIESELDSFQSLHFADEDVRLAPVPQILAELFTWIGGPVVFDVLVRMLARLLDIRDQQIDSLDDPSRVNVYPFANTHSGESHLEANELLARLWHAVIVLPPQQRDSFALGFEDHEGQDLFTSLLAAEIVNWSQLADGMGRSLEEVARLRVRMPMDSASVANELRTSRGNVYKWRFRALNRLKAELRGRK